MKKLAVLIVLVLSTSKVSAQFYNPYMGQVMWDTMENIQMNNNLQQMQAQTMMMQMQYMNYLSANAAAATYNLMNNPFGSMSMMTRDGEIISTENVSDYERRDITCSSCGGRGKITRSKPDYSTRTIRYVDEYCSDCHGRGSISRLVRK